jgi:hypothetical protein
MVKTFQMIFRSQILESIGGARESVTNGYETVPSYHENSVDDTLVHEIKETHEIRDAVSDCDASQSRDDPRQ